VAVTKGPHNLTLNRQEGPCRSEIRRIKKKRWSHRVRSKIVRRFSRNAKRARIRTVACRTKTSPEFGKGTEYEWTKKLGQEDTLELEVSSWNHDLGASTKRPTLTN